MSFPFPGSGNVQNLSTDLPSLAQNLSHSFQGFENFQDLLLESQCLANLLKVWQTSLVIGCVCGFLILFAAVYLLYSMARQNKIVQGYVINLIISDLLQLSSMVAMTAKPNNLRILVISKLIHRYGEMTSVAFMLCIAFERYLVIARPLWYHNSQTVKKSVVACVLVWLLSLTICLSSVMSRKEATVIMLTVYYVLPIPLFMFFLFGVLKSLSVAIHLSADEKRQIIGILVLPIVLYSVIFVPNIVAFHSLGNTKLYLVSITVAVYSPLANVILYVFIRKGSLGSLLAALCCCKMDNTPSTVVSVQMKPSASGAGS